MTTEYGKRCGEQCACPGQRDHRETMRKSVNNLKKSYCCLEEMGCEKGRFRKYYGSIFPANPNAAGLTTEYGTEEKLLREVYPLVLFFEIALSCD